MRSSLSYLPMENVFSGKINDFMVVLFSYFFLFEYHTSPLLTAGHFLIGAPLTAIDDREVPFKSKIKMWHKRERKMDLDKIKVTTNITRRAIHRIWPVASTRE